MSTERVGAVEVEPSGGLQNEGWTFGTAKPLERIDWLALARRRSLETTPFVSPRWVLQIICGLHLDAANDAAAWISKVPGRMPSAGKVPVIH
jgi:hypothetical protein